MIVSCYMIIQFSPRDMKFLILIMDMPMFV